MKRTTLGMTTFAACALAGIGATAGVLDGLSVPAAGAYGLRQLSAKYAGSAVEVRRSSDGNTAKIGFTAGGDLDVEALKKFVGKDTGTVQTWFDQSGNGRDLVQTNAGKQRVLVDAGSVVLFPGTQRPAITKGAAPGESFASTNAWGRIDYKGALTTVALVIHPLPSAPGMSFLYYSGDGGPMCMADKGAVIFDTAGGAPSIKSATNTVSSSLVVTYANPDATNLTRAVYVCGAKAGESEKKMKARANTQTGGQGVGDDTIDRAHFNHQFGKGFVGYWSELIYFTKKEVTPADRERIEGDEAWYFGLAEKLPAEHPHKAAAPKP
jgi:hypothetical protein